MTVRLVEEDNASALAGWARRKAMDAAATWLFETAAHAALILTTDADSLVSPEWIARNRAAISAGADATAGRIVFDPAEVAALSLAAQRRLKLEEMAVGAIIEKEDDAVIVVLKTGLQGGASRRLMMRCSFFTGSRQRKRQTAFFALGEPVPEKFSCHMLVRP